ncbi:Hypothetical protein FKW44_020259, partial [Caligus rogercresseyi]
AFNIPTKYFLPKASMGAARNRMTTVSLRNACRDIKFKFRWTTDTRCRSS